MTKRLQDKIALVTGSSRGIGFAIAEEFAREGARVIVSSRKKQNVDEAVQKINKRYPNSTTGVPFHVGNVVEHANFIDKIIESVGLPNILVNNAAANPYFGPMLGLDWSAWDKTFEVNLKAPFGLSREISKRLIDADANGSILNISSVYGLLAAEGQGIYGMTKAAMISMTKTMAHELGKQGIRINAIAPGLVETKFASAIVQNPQYCKIFTRRSALNRYAQPSEISGMAVFLASDESKFVTGQTFVVDGGYSVS